MLHWSSSFLVVFICPCSVNFFKFLPAVRSRYMHPLSPDALSQTPPVDLIRTPPAASPQESGGFFCVSQAGRQPDSGPSAASTQRFRFLTPGADAIHLASQPPSFGCRRVLSLGRKFLGSAPQAQSAFSAASKASTVASIANRIEACRFLKSRAGSNASKPAKCPPGTGPPALSMAASASRASANSP